MLGKRIKSVRDQHFYRAFQVRYVLRLRFEIFYLLNSDNFGFKSKSSQIMMNSRSIFPSTCCAGARLRPPQVSHSKSGDQYVAAV